MVWRRVQSPGGAPQAQELKGLQEQLTTGGAWDTTNSQEQAALLRFYRATSFNLPQCRKMWLEMKLWRKNNQVETLAQTFSFDELEEFIALFPQGYHKTDRMGRPVYVQCLGRCRLSDLAKVTTEERMTKWHIQEYEKLLHHILPACSAAAGRHIDQTYSILDLGKSRFRDFMQVRRLMTMFLELDQRNYPDTLGKMVIINSPDWFNNCFAFIKQLMSASTLARVQVRQRFMKMTRRENGLISYRPPKKLGFAKVLGSSYQDSLLADIAPENLPEEYGGRSQGELLDNIGPWSEITRRVSFSREASILRQAINAAQVHDVCSSFPDLEPYPESLPCDTSDAQPERDLSSLEARLASRQDFFSVPSSPNAAAQGTDTHKVSRQNSLTRSSLQSFFSYPSCDSLEGFVRESSSIQDFSMEALCESLGSPHQSGCGGISLGKIATSSNRFIRRRVLPGYRAQRSQRHKSNMTRLPKVESDGDLLLLANGDHDVTTTAEREASSHFDSPDRHKQDDVGYELLLTPQPKKYRRTWRRTKSKLLSCCTIQ